MRKQIDPNLNGFADGESIFGDDAKQNNDVSQFNINDDEQKNFENPDFRVAEKDDLGNVISNEPAEEKAAEIGSLNTDYLSAENHHRHHHRSSDSHHSGSHHHGHSHSHGKHRHKHKKKMPLPLKIAITVLVILLIVAVVAGGTVFYLHQTGKKDLVVETATPEYEETIEYNGGTYVYDKNKIAFAFIGVDKSDIDATADDEYGNSGQADTDMVAVFDTKTGAVSLIVIPRDTMVDIDLYSASGIFLRTEQKQLCLAYAYGDGGENSCTNVTSALSRILKNVPIEKYFALDLEGIAPLNDAVGGVTVTSLHDFPEKNIKTGDTVTIKGDFAETYVRSRDMDYIEASLNRTQRQSQYVKAYVGQLRNAITNDFSVVSQLYNTATQYSQTNITLNDVTYLASLAVSKGVDSFTTYSVNGEMKASEKISPTGVYAEFYADEDSLMDIVINCFYTKVG